MAEDWTERMIHNLRETYTDAALQARQEQERLGRIARAAPIFWRAVGDVCEVLLGEIRNGLRGQPIETALTSEMNPHTHLLTIAKEDFPAVRLTARPTFATGELEVLVHAGGHERRIPCRFELQSEQGVMLQLNGDTYTSADAAARWLIERAFRAPG